MKDINDKLKAVETEYYSEQLKEGQEFQDFVVEQLYKEGIVIVNYKSKKYQSQAENKFGLEIKYDKKYNKTGNLYLEFKEKRYSSQDRWYESGISNYDKCWLYCIGDYKCFYIFSTRTLYRERFKMKYRETPTSQGYLLSKEQAEDLYDRKYEF